MGKWGPPVLSLSSFVQGHPDPLSHLFPNTQALPGSSSLVPLRRRFQSKVSGSSTPQTPLLHPFWHLQTTSPFLPPLDNLNSILFFTYLEGNNSFVFFFFV